MCVLPSTWRPGDAALRIGSRVLRVYRSPGLLWLLAVLGGVLLCCPTQAQSPQPNMSKDAFASVNDALTLARTMSAREFAAFIRQQLADPTKQGADCDFFSAELLQQIGDYRAEFYFKRAIQKDPYQPAYELFYADYLRNFRGAQQPLFAEAKYHYFMAWTKLIAWKGDQNRKDTLKDRIDRGLVTLYEQDGMPLISLPYRAGGLDDEVKEPSAFFTSIDRYAQSTSDLDEIHDVRDFTSEALFAESPSRLNHPLMIDQLRQIARTKTPAETLDRIRFRHGNWPTLDLFYQDRNIGQAQITNFFLPNHFNSVRLGSEGVRLTKSVDLAPWGDMFIDTSYERIARVGAVEFEPQTVENIDQLETSVALSRFLGPNKLTLSGTYDHQGIHPTSAPPTTHRREIEAVKLDYLLLRAQGAYGQPYGQPFASRGVHLFVGWFSDKELFGSTYVRRQDVFVGTTWNGVHNLDITLQPALFSSSVATDATQSNSQLRIDLLPTYRILDEETQPGIPSSKVLGLYPAFLHVSLPLEQDTATHGPNSFENFKIGIQLDAKAFRRAFPSLPAQGESPSQYEGTTFLISLGYRFERFYRIDKNDNQVNLSFSMGF